MSFSRSVSEVSPAISLPKRKRFLPRKIQRKRLSKLTAEQLSEAVDYRAQTYWYLKGFKSGHEDGLQDLPPVWQIRNQCAWRRGKAHASRYGAIVIIPSGIIEKIVSRFLPRYYNCQM